LPVRIALFALFLHGELRSDFGAEDAMNHQVRWRRALEKIAANSGEPLAQKAAVEALAGRIPRTCPDCSVPRKQEDLLVCEPCRDDRNHIVRQRRILARLMRDKGTKYSLIAETLGISKQYVHTLLSATRQPEAIRVLRYEDEAYVVRKTARAGAMTPVLGAAVEALHDKFSSNRDLENHDLLVTAGASWNR
jgi:hypothetical protein